MSDGQGARLSISHLAVTIAAAGPIWIAVALPILSETLNWGEDFTAYRNAAERLAIEGSPYSAETLGGEFEPQGGLHYLYPPPLSIAFGIFTNVAAETGAVHWYLLKLGALALAAALMPVCVVAA